MHVVGRLPYFCFLARRSCHSSARSGRLREELLHLEEHISASAVGVVDQPDLNGARGPWHIIGICVSISASCATSWVRHQERVEQRGSGRGAVVGHMTSNARHHGRRRGHAATSSFRDLAVSHDWDEGVCRAPARTPVVFRQCGAVVALRDAAWTSSRDPRPPGRPAHPARVLSCL